MCAGRLGELLVVITGIYFLAKTIGIVFDMPERNWELNPEQGQQRLLVRTSSLIGPVLADVCLGCVRTKLVLSVCVDRSMP